MCKSGGICFLWKDLKPKFIRELQTCLNEHCYQHECVRPNSTTGRFDENNFSIMEETEGLWDDTSGNAEVIKLILTLHIVVKYSLKVEYMNFTKDDQHLPKDILSRVLRFNKLRLETSLNIAILYIEDVDRHVSWVEAWCWPLSMSILLFSVIGLKSGMYLVAKRMIYQGTAERMDKLAASKEKRRIVMEYLQHKYDAEAASTSKTSASNGQSEISENSTVCTVVTETKSNGGLVDVDCDSSYAPPTNVLAAIIAKPTLPQLNAHVLPVMETIQIEEIQRSLPATAKLRDGFIIPGAKLPLVGSPAHHFLITQLMTDALLDKEIRIMQMSTQDKSNGENGQTGLCDFICGSGGNESHKHKEKKPGRKANMFSMLVGGGKGNKKGPRVERVRL